MARKRDPRRNQALDIFLKNEGKIDLTKIADKLDVSAGTIRGWKSKDKWSEHLNGTFQSKVTERSDKNTERSNKKGAPIGNTNARGNSGNPSASPPRGNQNAFKHGLFAKHMPEESLKIAEELNDSDPSDIIWNNIMIQYTAIIRAQKIMFVESQDDLSKETSGWSSGAEGGSETYDIQYAWDKQANFMNAQARAMTALSKLIKQFVLISDEQDERRKKLELMDAQIIKLKAENSNNQTENEAVVIVDAWSDSDE